MTLFEIAGLMTLAIVILAGLILKRYTRKKLRDMDGLTGPSIATKKDAPRVVHTD